MTTAVAPSAPTPPGFNKHQRDISKLLLAATSFCLLTGMGSNVAIILSAIATIIIKQGTMGSIKNLKWITLSAISFLASIVSFSLLSGQRALDEEKAYELKFKMWYGGKFIQTVWGGILALFIISTYSTEAQQVQQHKLL